MKTFIVKTRDGNQFLFTGSTLVLIVCGLYNYTELKEE